MQSNETTKRVNTARSTQSQSFLLLGSAKEKALVNEVKSKFSDLFPASTNAEKARKSLETGMYIPGVDPVDFLLGNPNVQFLENAYLDLEHRALVYVHYFKREDGQYYKSGYFVFYQDYVFNCMSIHEMSGLISSLQNFIKTEKYEKEIEKSFDEAMESLGRFYNAENVSTPIDKLLDNLAEKLWRDAFILEDQEEATKLMNRQYPIEKTRA